MINYNYVIVRDEGSEQTEFRPVLIPTTLPILSSIEGPNSSGKSTLLDLIGICFNGNKSKSINESLVRKMNSMLDTKYQELEFDITILSKSETLKFIKERGKMNIDRFRVIGDTREYIDVDREYELIYDIPINPVERLKELTNEIRIEQEFTELKLRDFQFYLREIIDKAKKARDPKLIQQLEDKKFKIESSIYEKKRKLENKEQEILEYNRIYYVYHYNRLISQKSDQEFHHKKKTRAQKYEQNKLKKEYNSLSDLVSKYKDDLRDNHDEVSKILIELDCISTTYINLWKYVEPEEIFSKGFIKSTCTDAIRSIETEFRKQFDSNEVIIEEYNMLKQLYDVLQKFVEKDLNLSNEITAKDLLKTLKKRIEAQEKTVGIKELLEHAIDVLNEIDRDLTFVETDKFKRYKELHNKIDEIFDNNEVTPIDDNIDDLINSWKEKVIQFGINVDDREIIKQFIHKVNNNNDLRQLVDKPQIKFEDYIGSLHADVNTLNNDIEKNIGYLSGISNDLADVKNREKSEYIDYKDEIEHLINNVGDLINKFQSYKDYTDSLYNNRSLNSEKFEKYSNSLGNYLASKLGSILHIDKEYKLKSVDIRNNTFESIDGKLIRFSDMGTGQSQSAYLMSKLNSNTGKKLVALFDEIAMMDTNSLKPIFNKIKRMYHDNKLLTAIVVQKGDDLVIKSLEE